MPRRYLKLPLNEPQYDRAGGGEEDQVEPLKRS